MQKTEKNKSYNKAGVNKQETVIIIKPLEESRINSSEMTKRN